MISCGFPAPSGPPTSPPIHPSDRWLHLESTHTTLHNASGGRVCLQRTRPCHLAAACAQQQHVILPLPPWTASVAVAPHSRRRHNEDRSSQRTLRSMAGVYGPSVVVGVPCGWTATTAAGQQRRTCTRRRAPAAAAAAAPSTTAGVEHAPALTNTLPLCHTARQQTNNKQSIEDAAAAFLPHADGCSQEEVVGFLSQLGGIGPGLHSLLQSTPAAGPLFRE